jgi:hypothetical protein
MNKKQFEKEFKERQHQQQLKSLDANRNRAQSVSIGLSGGGTTEITMRGVDGYVFVECIPTHGSDRAYTPTCGQYRVPYSHTAPE